MKSLEHKSSLLLDVFFCAVFMPILVLLGPAHNWLGQWPLFSILACAFLYGCYFLLMRINVPHLLIARRIGVIGGVLAGLTLLNYLLSLYPLPEVEFVTPSLSEYQTSVRNFGVSITLWLMFSLVIGYALTVSFVKEMYDQLLLRKKIEAQRNKAELAMFKAQISPHFMFNTLNSLYGLVLSGSQKTEEAFVKFTELLRYTYVTVDKDLVTLREEVDYIQNYIDLQRLRLNECTITKWECLLDDDTLQVPPMLMLTFVENAFKYGASTSQPCVITIRISQHDDTLEFETINQVMKHSEDFRRDVPTGIENCRSRLSNLFPERFALKTEEVNGVFKVFLKLQLR
ncbi:MAG: sensor histidine kinase [Bacteroidales bacterium]|nr:sensor histidine kinase [Bacteroidales bacterium]